MKQLLIILALLVSNAATQQKPGPWKPQNEVQRTAEDSRLRMQRDIVEVIQIHYSNVTKEERAKLIAVQRADISDGTSGLKKFASAVSQAVAYKRCLEDCMAEIEPLLKEFSAMTTTLQKLNQEQIEPELVPLVRATFDLQLKSAGYHIRAIHLR
jgi:hypothetical protein